MFSIISRVLRRYLLKKVTKRWYDYERPNIHYVRHIREGGRVQCAYTSDFDRNGIMYVVPFLPHVLFCSLFFVRGGGVHIREYAVDQVPS
jgi:hypothetical protein